MEPEPWQLESLAVYFDPIERAKLFPLSRDANAIAAEWIEEVRILFEMEDDSPADCLYELMKLPTVPEVVDERVVQPFFQE